MFFNNYPEDLERKNQLIKKLEKENMNYQYRIERILDNQDRQLKLQKEDYERKLMFFKDDELKKAKEAQLKAERQLEVNNKELELMKQAVNVNADIIDVKSMVEKLIEKLPSINLSTLNVNNKD
jgi:hypothetical protein